MCGFDKDTFERLPKPSSAFFKEVIAANGISGELVAKYLTHFPSTRDLMKAR
jgi:hypothetical protein